MVRIKRCFACGSTVKDDRVILHRFPKYTDTYSKWKHFCGSVLRTIREEDDFRRYFLCSRHFKNEDYETMKTLSREAVPSIFYTKRARANGTTDIQSKSLSQTKTILEDQTDVAKDEFQLNPDPLPVKPLGDDLLRVCRTCFRILKLEESVPLLSSKSEDAFEETELCIRLKSFLQMDLFAVEKPCLCKICENFINAAHSFRETYKANEDVLRDFDWDCKTLNLLYVVDQDDLKTAYDKVKAEKCQEAVRDVELDPDFAATWMEQDEKGNGLSDMEDHWYNKDQVVDVDQDYTSKAYYSYALPMENDLFSPNFDRYFERVRDRPSQRLRKRCKRFHFKDEGTGPFVCEFCGKVKNSRSSFYTHLKTHESRDGFHCTDCDKVLYEWTGYLKHCKSVHGNCPRSFKCSRCDKGYFLKKKFDAHLKIHELEDAEFACLICWKVFEDESLFNKHKLSHRPERILCELCGISVHRKFLKKHIRSKHSNRNIFNVVRETRIFKCHSCNRSYSRMGCLELHTKHCDKAIVTF